MASKKVKDLFGYIEQSVNPDYAKYGQQEMGRQLANLTEKNKLPRTIDEKPKRVVSTKKKEEKTFVQKADNFLDKIFSDKTNKNKDTDNENKITQNTNTNINKPYSVFNNDSSINKNNINNNANNRYNLNKPYSVFNNDSSINENSNVINKNNTINSKLGKSYIDDKTNKNISLNVNNLRNTSLSDTYSNNSNNKNNIINKTNTKNYSLTKNTNTTANTTKNIVNKDNINDKEKYNKAVYEYLFGSKPGDKDHTNDNFLDKTGNFLNDFFIGGVDEDGNDKLAKIFGATQKREKQGFEVLEDDEEVKKENVAKFVAENGLLPKNATKEQKRAYYKKFGLTDEQLDKMLGFGGSISLSQSRINNAIKNSIAPYSMEDYQILANVNAHKNGNKLMNFITDTAGSMVGMSMMPGGGVAQGTNLLNVSDDVAEQLALKTTAKASKYVPKLTNSYVGQVGTKSLRGGIDGGIGGGIDTLRGGADSDDLLGNVTKGAVGASILQTGGKVVGDIRTKNLNKKLNLPTENTTTIDNINTTTNATTKNPFEVQLEELDKVKTDLSTRIIDISNKENIEPGEVLDKYPELKSSAKEISQKIENAKIEYDNYKANLNSNADSVPVENNDHYITKYDVGSDTYSMPKAENTVDYENALSLRQPTLEDNFNLSKIYNKNNLQTNDDLKFLPEKSSATLKENSDVRNTLENLTKNNDTKLLSQPTNDILSNNRPQEVIYNNGDIDTSPKLSLRNSSLKDEYNINNIYNKYNSKNPLLLKSGNTPTIENINTKNITNNPEITSNSNKLLNFVDENSQINKILKTNDNTNLKTNAEINTKVNTTDVPKKVQQTSTKKTITIDSSENADLLRKYAKGEVKSNEVLSELENTLDKARFNVAIKQDEIINKYNIGAITEAQKNTQINSLNKQITNLETSLKKDKQILNAITKKKIELSSKKKIVNSTDEMAMSVLHDDFNGIPSKKSKFNNYKSDDVINNTNNSNGNIKGANDDLLESLGISTTKSNVDVKEATKVKGANDDLLESLGISTTKSNVDVKEATKVKGANDDLLESLGINKKVRDVKVDENGIERMNNKIAFTEEEPKSLIDRFKSFYTRAVDINNPLKKSSEKTYELATNSSKANGIVSSILDHNLTDMKGKTLGKSLKKLLADIPKLKRADFWEYMLQRHNIDRAKYKKNVSFDFDSEQSRIAVEKFEQLNPEFKAKADEIVKWIDDFMYEWGVKGGLIDEATYRNMRKMYPNYIPTNRFFSEEELAKSFREVSEKYVDLALPFKKAKGSDRDIVHPVESMLNMINSTVKTAKYNEVGLSFLTDVRKGNLGDMAKELPIDTPVNKNNIITIIENGKKVKIELNDKEILNALQKLDRNIDGKIAKAIRPCTQMFNSLITTYNPLFSFFNAFRDLQNYFVNSIELNPFKKLWTLAESYAEIIGIKDRTTYEMYRNLGNEASNFVSKNNTSRIAQEIYNGKTTKNPIKLLGKGIEVFNNAIETAPRLAEFKNTLKKGGSLSEASYNAGDVTTNFAKYGDIIKELDSGVSFLNASVQGVDKVYRQFKNHPIATTVNGLAYITAPTLLSNSMNKDDENYQMLNNRNKDNYYNFKKKDGTYFRLPKSRDYGTIFGAIPERILRYADGDKKAFKGIGETLKNGLAPVDPLESNILSPIINLARNKDFADRTIVSPLLQNYENSEQYDEKTSEIGKFLGKTFNQSPKQIDYLIDASTGIIGDVVLPATTGIKSPSDIPKNVLRNVVTNKFINNPLYSNQEVSDFYDNYDAVHKRYRTDKDRREIDIEGTEVEKVNRDFNNALEEFSDINKEILKYNANTEAGKMKIESLKRKQIATAKKLNALYERSSLNK